MFEQDPKEEALHIIKEIEANPDITQRILSKKLGISLGKVNYILSQLIGRGFVKIKNFYSNPGKLRKISYIITVEGIEEKMRLVYVFLKRKEVEYNSLKQEWDKFAAIGEAKSTGDNNGSQQA